VCVLVLQSMFTELDRVGVRRMFQLHDLRESMVWQEAEKSATKKGAKKDVR
jgi:hypothetical protein